MTLSHEIASPIVAGENPGRFAPSHTNIRIERIVSQVFVIDTTYDVDNWTAIGFADGGSFFPAPRPIDRLAIPQRSAPCTFRGFRLIAVGMARRWHLWAKDYMPNWNHVFCDRLSEIEQARINPLGNSLSELIASEALAIVCGLPSVNQLCLPALFHGVSVLLYGYQGEYENHEGGRIYWPVVLGRYVFAPLLPA